MDDDNRDNQGCVPALAVVCAIIVCFILAYIILLFVRP